MTNHQKMARKTVGAIIVLLLLLGSSPTRAREADQTPNVHLLQRFRYNGGDVYTGTDTDFEGDFAYGGHYGKRGGVHIFDISGTRAKEVSFIRCPGQQNDVAVVQPGIIALGFHSSSCARVRSGIQLIDVHDPKHPKFLGAVEIPSDGTHTMTVYPGKPIIYSSNSGAASVESIIDASDPRRPRIVTTFDSNVGCHDLSFWFKGKEKLAFCAGSSTGSEIWDVSDPFEPEVISTIVNPLIYFHHSIAATPDGELLAIGDESALTCTGESAPTSAIWFYDIRDRSTPRPVGYFSLSRTSSRFCTAHNFEFIPGTRLLLSSWYGGGMNVIDASDPANPVEAAHFQSEDTDYWSAFWHDGRVYASGVPGLDIFEIDGIQERRGGP